MPLDKLPIENWNIPLRLGTIGSILIAVISLTIYLTNLIDVVSYRTSVVEARALENTEDIEVLQKGHQDTRVFNAEIKKDLEQILKEIKELKSGDH
jgi:hypothetical protein